MDRDEAEILVKELANNILALVEKSALDYAELEITDNGFIERVFAENLREEVKEELTKFFEECPEVYTKTVDWYKNDVGGIDVKIDWVLSEDTTT